jgi:Putative DNA-binding domain
MPPPSLARAFFDQVVGSGEPVAAIRGLINSNPLTTESDYFDCKLEHIDEKKREKGNKEIWSKVLGGFANSGGGVVIWGLDARKTKIDEREVDAVVGEKFISHPRILEARLRELQRQATDPPLANVEIKAYPLPDDESKGFVVCFIPEGPFKPYRSEQSGQQFYMRAGDSTPVMPKAVLSAMFHPRSQAVFRVSASLEYKASPRQMSRGARHGLAVSGVDKIVCRMELFNDGTATAKEIRGYLTWGLPGEKELFQPVGGPSWLDNDSKCAFNRSFPIHPGEEGAHVCSISWTVEHRVIDQDVNRGDPLPFIELNIYCENQGPQTITLRFNLRELVNEEKLTLEETVRE